MLITTKGIVIRAVKYGETSLIVDIYTEQKGLRSYVANGVRKPKSHLPAGLLQPMSIVEMVVYHRDEKDLNRIKELKNDYVYESLPFEMRKSAVGLFMVELVRKTIKEVEENAALFAFLYDNFVFLDTTKKSCANVPLSFMVHLSGFLGFMPSEPEMKDSPIFDLKSGIFTQESPIHPNILRPPLTDILLHLLQLPLSESHQVPINRTMRHELLAKLLWFYQFHLAHFSPMQSHLILQEVLEA